MHGIPEDFTGFDQMIVGYHRTRHDLNARYRQQLGYTSPLPQVGERLVCEKTVNRLGLVKGEMAQVIRVGELRHDFLQMWVLPESSEDKPVEVRTPITPFVDRRVTGAEGFEHQPFSFGYAITVWKAQGSEWQRALVCREVLTCKTEEHKQKWLYTAVTRARENVVVVW